MSTINIAMIRLFQGLAGIFFVFINSAYFGLLLLFPLAALYHLTNSFTGLFGFEGIGGVILALPITGAILYGGFKVPGLLDILIDTGMSIVKLSRTQILKYEELVQQQRGYTGSVPTNNAV